MGGSQVKVLSPQLWRQEAKRFCRKQFKKLQDKRTSISF